MRFRRAALVTASVALAGLVPHVPAQARVVLPAWAPLVSAAGDKSGCVAQAIPFKLTTRLYVRAGVRTRCDVQWGRLRQTLYFFEVTSDGTWVPLFQGAAADGLQAPGPAPGVWSSLTNGYACSDLPGTRDLVVRGVAKVKTSASDPNPYTAVVEARTTISCPD
jgi:hypothetical protein